jgi:hypothetical protein
MKTHFRNHHQAPERFCGAFVLRFYRTCLRKWVSPPEQLKTARMLFASGVVTGVGRRTGHQAERCLVSCNDVGLRWRKAGWVSSALIHLQTSLGPLNSALFELKCWRIHFETIYCVERAKFWLDSGKFWCFICSLGNSILQNNSITIVAFDICENWSCFEVYM